MFKYYLFATVVAVTLAMPYDKISDFQSNLYSEMSNQFSQPPSTFGQSFESSSGSLGYPNGIIGSSIASPGAPSSSSDPLNSFNSLYGGLNYPRGSLDNVGGNLEQTPGSFASPPTFLGQQVDSLSSSLGYSNGLGGPPVGSLGISNMFGGLGNQFGAPLGYTGGSSGSSFGTFGQSNLLNGNISPISGPTGSNVLGAQGLLNTPIVPSTGSFGNSISPYGSSEGSYSPSNFLSNQFISPSGPFGPASSPQGPSSLFFSNGVDDDILKESQFGPLDDDNTLDFNDDETVRNGRNLPIGAKRTSIQGGPYKINSSLEFRTLGSENDLKVDPLQTSSNSPFDQLKKARNDPTKVNPSFTYIKGGAFHR